MVMMIASMRRQIDGKNDNDNGNYDNFDGGGK